MRRLAVWLEGHARTELVRERLFQLSVLLKGADALLEVIGGAALLLVSPAFILRTIAVLTQQELAEDPRDLVANFLLYTAKHLSVSGQHFIAYYLLVHGAVKVVLVVELLRRELRAYPLAELVFAAFIVYQVYRFSITRAPGLIALSLFDLALIVLIHLEYKALKRHRAAIAR